MLLPLSNSILNSSSYSAKILDHKQAVYNYQLQRIITEQNKILASEPPFAAKRMAQKAKLEAVTKLGMIVVKPDE